MNCLRGLLALLFTLICIIGAAQIPSDLSNVKASQISDAQLQQILSRAKSSGMSQDEVEAELARRGLPRSELAELKQRIQLLDGYNSSNDQEADNDVKTSASFKRTAQRSKSFGPESFDLETKSTRIFGSELFSNSNLTFEPDLRMATPRNYVIGPEDELILNIYGVNISQQTLRVTPDGTVNVKYAGVINVNGLTIDAAAAIMKSRLTKYYPALNSGQTKLQLTIGNVRSIRVILIGAIKRPGTYTLPSLASLFNALYVSGGPAENGSLRRIELVRNNKVIQVADLYDFLLKGDLTGNIRLEDNDVVRVPFANLLITLDGQLNRPGIFELRNSETLNDAIQFAGGFKSKAFKGRITGNRYSDFDKKVLDVAGDSLAYIKPQNGDEFIIDSLLDRYQNRVTIKGAVFKPGSYALEDGMTLKRLINKAQGLKEDVFAGRALVVRTRKDLTKEYISVELRPVAEGKTEGLFLQREDSVQVASIFDLKDTTTVTINGAVRKPGTYRYEDKLSLKSLIMKAEGYADNATGLGIEISRRKRDVNINKPGSDIVELIKVNDDKELSDTSTDIELKPFDIITIKEDPFYKKQISVKISGEVLLPGVYTLKSREERIYSLLERSGGLLYTANIAGAKLVRKAKPVTDTSQIMHIFKSVQKDTSLSRAKADIVNKTTTDVAIDLKYILNHPGSMDDITLEDSDELIIPRINNTVSINGEVFKPLEVMFEKGKSMKDYLSDAGGVTQLGKRSKAFVIYANGRSARIKRPLGIFRSYPEIEPGSSIFVPQKPKRESGFDTAKAGILVSAITAMITAIAVFKK